MTRCRSRSSDWAYELVFNNVPSYFASPNGERVGVPRAQGLYRQPCWITKILRRASSDRLPPWSSPPRPLKRPPSARRRCGRMTARGSGRYVWFECSCSLSILPVRGQLCSIAENRNAAPVPYMSYAAGIMFQASNRHRFALQEVGFLPRARANGSRHCRPSRIVIG